MVHRFTRGGRRRAAAAVTLSLAGLFAAPAFAKIVVNTIDPTAIVADKGRHIVATGPIACTAGEKVYLDLAVTQRATGAVAYGRTRLNCTGETQRWQVHAVAQGDETFVDGAATAVALARTSAEGAITDAHQWLVNITLVGEP